MKEHKNPSPPLAAGEGRGEGGVLQECASKMRKDPTEAEKIFWQRIRNRQVGGLKFRRQYPIDSYIPDFVCFDPKVIIEIDGGQHNESHSDPLRDAYFQAQGFKIIRFWNNEVMTNIEGVLESLVLNVQSPSSQPSPAASGGEGDKEQKGISHA